MKNKNSTKNLASKPGISQLYRNKSPLRIIDPPVCEYYDDSRDIHQLNSNSSKLLKPFEAIVSVRSSIMLIAGDNQKESERKETTFKRNKIAFGKINFSEDPTVIQSPKFSRYDNESI